ncbi:MAG: SDR family oxidoreductase [Phyllobacteriaceae bacterium]|nr:SDR family oxidoreductase [Phyllobacteriaceae bacterium]
MRTGARILVTGGAGFLGSAVCDRLIAEGAQVVCVDNLLTGRRKNIEHLIASSRFTFIEGDVRTDLPEGPFNEIWNLASPASPPQYPADPVGTLLINVNGMHNVLELARRCGARVFQASTSEVYGDPEVHPQTESYKGSVNMIGPRACYDEGKRAAETLCFDYQRTYGVEIRVVRIFNTYGPRMDPKDGRVVSNFVVNALAGKPLELYGGGVQTRSFCYRDDLVEGFFRLMNHPTLTGPINIGNPNEFTIRELADLVLEMTGSTSGLIEKPLPADDPKQRRPDISHARELLGWEPKIQLREGLERTIAHFAGVAAEAKVA